MTRRVALVACAVLIGSLPVLAQREDPVSGEWGTDSRTVLSLRLGTGGAVSGTVFLADGGAAHPVPVARGTFDSAASTLRLEGEATRPNGQTIKFVIRGKLAQDALDVEGTFGETTGALRLVRVGVQPRAAEVAPGVVLITGSNRGLGLEFARQYAARGWTVIATARNPDDATELRALAAGNARVTIEKLDLLDIPGLKALAARYRGRPIDLVVNNAGVLGDLDGQALGSLDPAQFEEVMAVNVYGALAVSEAFRENVAASRHKKIVSITSGSGILSRPGVRGPYFYNASKAALNMVMRILSNDLRDRGVVVGIVAPGVADTDMRREVVGAEQASREPRPADAVAAMMKVIDGLTMAQSGQPLNVDGTPLPW